MVGLKRRGQVTLFIIIGIILLVIAVSFFSLRGYVEENIIDKARPVAEKVPLEFEPVRSFTTECLKAVSEEGTFMLGQQGGYIKPEGWQNLRFSEQDQTDMEGVILGGAKIPYWLYNKAPNKENSVSFATLRPSLNSMEDELERWVEEEVEACLDSYSSVSGYKVEESDEVKATVNILPGMIKIALKHPIKSLKGSTEVQMENFYTELKLDLFHMYAIASEIANTQQNSSFLEKNTLNLLALFSDTEEDRLPPMTGATFKLANNLLWSEIEVKEDIKSMLVNYVPLLRFYNSKNFFRREFSEGDYPETTQRVYDDMVLPMSGAEDLEVRFDYLGWEPYFHTNADGGVIQPQDISISFAMINFGTQRFKTVYDISYPVIVSLKDPDAYGGRGYTFNFALEANVRDNRPLKADTVMLEPLGFAKDSLFCDVYQRNSGNIIVIVKDAYSKQLILDAQIAYVIGDESCTIGTTDSTGTLIEKFPVAYGGVVHAVSEGYLGSSRVLDTELGKDDTITIELWPFKEINATIKKKNVVKCDDDGCFRKTQYGHFRSQMGKGWFFFNAPLNLDKKEEANLVLTRVSQFDDPFNYAFNREGVLRMPPGKYKVNSQLILFEEITIAPSERCEDIELAGIDVDKKCYKVPEEQITFPSLPDGGLVWENETLLDIEPDNFYGSDKITFYVIGLGISDIPKDKIVIEDISQITKIEEYSETYKDKLQPAYS